MRTDQPGPDLFIERPVDVAANGADNGTGNGHTGAPSTAADCAELPFDTTGMNAGQQAAIEVTESARDSVAERGFADRLFLGRFEAGTLRNFPRQDDEDRAIGDALVQRVTSFLAAHLDPDEVDETREIPVEVIEGLRDLGVLRMKVPQAYGGLGLSQMNYNRVIMAIASYCGSTAVLVSAHQSIGVPQPLKMFGTPEQKQAWLPRIAEGAISAFALTEPGVGSDPAQMTTTATLTADGSAYVLNGEKLWTTNGPIADVLVVMARTAPRLVRGRMRPQITAFLVDGDAPGVEVTHRCDFMGLRAIQNGLMRFRDVVVPAENVLWGEGLGLKLALRTLNTGRLTLPAACTGMAKQSLSIVRRWGNERVQWGLAVGRHEAGRDKIAAIAATTFAMEAVTRLTSHWADEGRDIRVEAAMAKLFCSERCWSIVDQTMQLRGGRGYERATSLRARGEAPYPVERSMRDARINTIIEGTSEIMRLFLAREALDPHLTRAADLLRRGVPVGRRVACAARLAGFYAGWYPRRVLGAMLPALPGATGGGGPLARHERYVARRAHRLALRLMHAMVRHGPRLERRQMLLGHLMEIGTELFVMATTCAYARSLAEGATGAQAVELAEVLCRQSRRRIGEHFRQAGSRDVRRANALAARVLDDELGWLEAGIIPVGELGAAEAEPTASGNGAAAQPGMERG